MKKSKPFYFRLEPLGLMTALIQIPEDQRGVWITQIAVELAIGKPESDFAKELFNEAEKYQQEASERSRVAGLASANKRKHTSTDVQHTSTDVQHTLNSSQPSKQLAVSSKQITITDNQDKSTMSDFVKSDHTKTEVVNELFESFWIAFNYKSGKQQALAAWNKIKPPPEQANQIIEAAAAEASIRPHRIANGQTPKMAQGWLSAKRWQDEHPVAIPLNIIQQKKVQQHIESSDFLEAYNALPFG